MERERKQYLYNKKSVGSIVKEEKKNELYKEIKDRKCRDRK